MLATSLELATKYDYLAEPEEHRVVKDPRCHQAGQRPLRYLRRCLCLSPTLCHRSF